MLVVGSGASGLAAALSAERAGARVALATKGTLQSCNSAKAQGGIQASFGEDDSPELHAEDVWRSSHETADRRLVEILTGEAQSAIHWLEELGVEFTRDRASAAQGSSRRAVANRRSRQANGATGSPAAVARAGSGCSRSATAPAMRSRPRSARPSSRLPARPFPSRRCRRSSPERTAGAHAAARTRRSRRRPSSSPQAAAATARPRSAASSRPTTRVRPAR